MDPTHTNHPSQLSGAERDEFISWLDSVDAETGCTNREIQAADNLSEMTITEKRFPTVEKPYVVKTWAENSVHGFTDLEKAVLFLERRNLSGRGSSLFLNTAV